MTVTVLDIERAVGDAFPIAWAEPWDNVGLVVGDRAAPVTSVLVSLDPTPETIDRAADDGHDVLVTHHPASLGSHATITSTGSGAALYRAASRGVALIAAHTNLDRAPGAADALVEALGLPPGRPLERSLQPVDLIVTFVPSDDAETVRAAMAEAGAGRIGTYREAGFEVSGTGFFRAADDSHPSVGRPGQPEAVDEVRVEMVAERGVGSAVAEATARAHPYEEPLVVVVESSIRRGAARLGRVCELEEPTSLDRLVESVSGRLGCTPRVWGPGTSEVVRIAVATGSGGSLIGHAAAQSADVLVAGEVRYHDALDALARGMCVIEAGHDVTEWPLVPVLADAVRATPGLSHDSVVIDPPRCGWWTP